LGLLCAWQPSQFTFGPTTSRGDQRRYRAKSSALLWRDNAALSHEAISAFKTIIQSFLLFRRCHRPLHGLPVAAAFHLPEPDELSERIGPVNRYFDHALMGNGSSNIGGTGNFSILNRQTILGRRFAASGSRFDSDIPNAVIGWCPSERRPGQQEQRRN
jgi:hypothetical protein